MSKTRIKKRQNGKYSWMVAGKRSKELLAFFTQSGSRNGVNFSEGRNWVVLSLHSLRWFMIWNHRVDADHEYTEKYLLTHLNIFNLKYLL